MLPQSLNQDSDITKPSRTPAKERPCLLHGSPKRETAPSGPERYGSWSVVGCVGTSIGRLAHVHATQSKDPASSEKQWRGSRLGINHFKLGRLVPMALSNAKQGYPLSNSATTRDGHNARGDVPRQMTPQSA